MSDHVPSHRLHPSSLIFQFISSVRGYFIPFVLMIFFGASGAWGGWGIYIVISFFVLVTGAQIVRYLSLRYRFDQDELVVTHGILSRNERHIPFDRIQNIDLVQNPLHRAIGVAEIRLQTASGQKPEAVLQVLSMDAIKVMRERVFRGRDSAATTGEHATSTESTPIRPTPEVIARLGTGDLIRLGLISNRGQVLVAAGLGAVFEFGQFENLTLAPFFERLFENKDGLMANFDLFRVFLGAIAVFTLVAAVLIGLSIAWTIVRFHGFTLSRVGDGFRISCGLFTRRTATIPAGRIQYISIRQTAIARFLKQVNIQIETAGGSGGKGEDSQTFSSRWFLPVLPGKRLQDVLTKVLPGLDLPQGQWNSLPAKAIRRTTKRAIRNWLLISIVIGIALWPWGFIAVVILPPIGVYISRRAHAKMAYAITPETVLFRSGLLTHTTSAAKIEKIQAVSLRESPFDRRWAMATILVDTAGSGIISHRIRIPYLDRADANKLARELSSRTEAAA